MVFINNIVKEAFLPSHTFCKIDLTLITTPSGDMYLSGLCNYGSAVWGGEGGVSFRLALCSVPPLDKEEDYVNFSI